MIELCDSRLGTTALTSVVDNDVNVIDNIVNTHPAKRTLGYKPAVYVGGNVSVDIVFKFPVSLSSLRFSTSCSKTTQAQVWISRKMLSLKTPTSSNYLTMLKTISISPPTSSIILSRDSNQKSRNTPNASRDTPNASRDTQYFSDTTGTRACLYLRITVFTFGVDRWLGDVSILGDVGDITDHFLERNKTTKSEILSLVKQVKSDNEKVLKSRNTHSDKTSYSLSLCHTSTSSPFTTALASQSSGSDSRLQVMKSSRSVASKDEVTSQFDTPEEFLDPITREIMVCPVILPSGNVVDSCTLEKHRKEEMKWGRESSDPFTGIVLGNSDTAPIYHTSLKERIDRWKSDMWRRDSSGTSLGVGDRGGKSLGVGDRGGKSVGVGDRGGKSVGVGDQGPLSLQIISRKAKRTSTENDMHGSIRSKRLKRFENSGNSNQTVDAYIAKSQSHHNTDISSKILSNPAHRRSELKSGKQKAGDLTFQLNTGSNNESFSVERTLEQLARHEERLDIF